MGSGVRNFGGSGCTCRRFHSSEIPVPRIIRANGFSNARCFYVDMGTSKVACRSSSRRAIIQLLNSVASMARTVSQASVSNASNYNIFSDSAKGTPFCD